MAKRTLTRCAVTGAVAVASMLAAATSANATLLPGYYSIQAAQPFPTAPHLFVGATTSSTTAPLRLMSGNIPDPIQRQRVQWQIDELPGHFGAPHTYHFINRYYHGCETSVSRPSGFGNGTYAGLAVQPHCTNWFLNNGSRWVSFSDPHGTQDGFQPNVATGNPRPVYCLDVTGLQYVANNHLQYWLCTGNWNQRYFIRRAE
jgi:hypothetical protein